MDMEEERSWADVLGTKINEELTTPPVQQWIPATSSYEELLRQNNLLKSITFLNGLLKKSTTHNQGILEQTREALEALKKVARKDISAIMLFQRQANIIYCTLYSRLLKQKMKKTLLTPLSTLIGRHVHALKAQNCAVVLQPEHVYAMDATEYFIKSVLSLLETQNYLQAIEFMLSCHVTLVPSKADALLQQVRMMPNRTPESSWFLTVLTHRLEANPNNPQDIDYQTLAHVPQDVPISPKNTDCIQLQALWDEMNYCVQQITERKLAERFQSTIETALQQLTA